MKLKSDAYEQEKGGLGVSGDDKRYLSAIEGNEIKDEARKSALVPKMGKRCGCRIILSTSNKRAGGSGGG